MNSDESFLKKLDNELTTGQGVTNEARGILHREKIPSVASDWINEPQDDIHKDDLLDMKRDAQKSYFKKIFIGSVIFALLCAGLFVVSLFTGRARLNGENVQLSVSAKSFADSGEEVNTQVTIVNQNTSAMEFTKLIFTYPLGTTRDPNAMKEVSQDLGTIGPGETLQKVFPIQLYGEQGTEKELSAMLEYRLQGSNAIFEKTNSTKLTLRSSIATLVATAPSSLLSGQELPIQLTISGNTASIVKNAMIVGEYPDGCEYANSDVEPTLDKNIWYLGDLPAGSQKQITVNLSCTGITNSEKNIRFTLGSQDATNERKIASVYTSAEHLIKLSLPFISTDIRVQGSKGVPSLRQNRDTTMTLTWKNNLTTTVTNVQIKARFSGDAFDPEKITPENAYFDSATNTLVWTPNEDSQLKSIEPGQTGTFTFTLTPRSSLDKSATVQLATSVSGIGFGGVEQSAIDATKITLPIATDVQFITKTLYHSGPLTNTGPMPMQVGKKTTFTIIWQLANTTNPVENVTVKATLPTGVSWEDVVAPSTDKQFITYNNVTREIVWSPGSVGVGQDAKNIAFRVSVTPVANQVGTVLVLVKDLFMTATDSITKTIIEQEKRQMETRLVGDTSRVGVDGKVVK